MKLTGHDLRDWGVGRANLKKRSSRVGLSRMFVTAKSLLMKMSCVKSCEMKRTVMQYGLGEERRGVLGWG